MASFISGPAASVFTSAFRGVDQLGARVCPARDSRAIPRVCRTRMQTNSVISADANGSMRSEADVYHEDVLQEQNKQEAEDVAEDGETEFEDGEAWYSIAKPIAKPDTGSLRQRQAGNALGSDDGVVDLAALDGMGREVLAGASYNQVVDVDIDEGGVLDDDEDNNDLFCGVGLDALIESDQLVKNLRESFNIETATHVQLSAIPRVMDKRDIAIQSHTGTGKTLAFLLPLLDEMDVERSEVQGVIVAPTRELAMQICRECERLCENTGISTMALIGGANPARQVEKLRKRQPHVVVGTPGRVAELVENRELRVRGVDMFVVDEVDQCIQEAMVEDVVYLLKTMMRRTQKVLVSATSDVDSVRAFAGQYLHKPVLLRVGGAQRLPKQITHWYCVVPARMRIELIRKLMHSNPQPTRAIAFVNDPRRVDMVVERLYRMNIVAGALRGNAHKLERAEVLTAFRKGKITLLVTTEIAARGLDIPEISHVFNVDLPTDGDHYVHRAGRCGRAGNPGTVVSITTADTAFVVGRLEKELGVTITRMEPRGGEYGGVVERPLRRDSPAKRSESRTQSTRRLATGGTNSHVKDRGNTATTLRWTGDSYVGPKDEGFESGEVIDKAAIMKLVRQLDAEGHPVGAVGEERTVKKAKKKAKLKSALEEKSSKDSEKAKPKVKLRWRDTKNKGKPKGKIRKGVTSMDSITMGGTQADMDEKVDVVDTGKAAGKPRAPKRKPGVRGRGSKRDLRLRALEEGWVGNR